MLQLLQTTIRNGPFHLHRGSIILRVQICMKLCVFNISPSNETMLHTLTMFLHIFPFSVSCRTSGRHASGTSGRVRQMGTQRNIFGNYKGSLYSVRCLYEGVHTKNGPRHLSSFVGRVSGRRVKSVQGCRLFMISLLRVSHPLSVFFALSQTTLDYFTLSFTTTETLQVRNFFSQFDFFTRGS